jgi:protein-tyrosine phosphatase
MAPEIKWTVQSAGIRARAGNSASNIVIDVLNKRNFDISNHQTQPITRQLVENFELILTMEDFHKEAIQTEFPESKSRLYMLSEMSNLRINVQDPVGKKLEDFLRCVDEIDQWVLNGMPRILEILNYPNL